MSTDVSTDVSTDALVLDSPAWRAMAAAVAAPVVAQLLDPACALPDARQRLHGLQAALGEAVLAPLRQQALDRLMAGPPQWRSSLRARADLLELWQRAAGHGHDTWRLGPTQAAWVLDALDVPPAPASPTTGGPVAAPDDTGGITLLCAVARGAELDATSLDRLRAVAAVTPRLQEALVAVRRDAELPASQWRGLSLDERRQRAQHSQYAEGLLVLARTSDRDTITILLGRPDLPAEVSDALAVRCGLADPPATGARRVGVPRAGTGPSIPGSTESALKVFGTLATSPGLRAPHRALARARAVDGIRELAARGPSTAVPVYGSLDPLTDVLAHLLSRAVDLVAGAPARRPEADAQATPEARRAAARAARTEEWAELAATALALDGVVPTLPPRLGEWWMMPDVVVALPVERAARWIQTPRTLDVLVARHAEVLAGWPQSTWSTLLSRPDREMRLAVTRALATVRSVRPPAAPPPEVPDAEPPGASSPARPAAGGPRRAP